MPASIPYVLVLMTGFFMTDFCLRNFSGREVLSPAEMDKLDSAAVADGLSIEGLMERAGFKATQAIMNRFDKQRVLVLCGSGHNGGDGFVVARLLKAEGWPVKVCVITKVDNIKPAVRLNLERWEQGGGQIDLVSDSLLAWAGLLVDAIFGSGLNKPLPRSIREVLENPIIRQTKIVAIDLPTGLDPYTGQQLSDKEPYLLKYILTVTFVRPKFGHILQPGRSICGETLVANIGISSELIKNHLSCRNFINGPALWTLPQPGMSDHKYSRGTTIMFGGKGMTGAVCLASQAARRIGSGMLYIVAHRDTKPFYVSDAPGNIFLPADTFDIEKSFNLKYRVAGLIGPGYGVGAKVRRQVKVLLKHSRHVVLDADAITSFEDCASDLFSYIKYSDSSVVMTPHEGEFQRLFGPRVSSTNKCEKAKIAAKISGAIIVLKGNDTIIANPDGSAVISINAVAGLATAGSGDVLAGLIVGLMAQGMSGWEAACAGVWLHGEAGALCSHPFIAEDLINNISHAVQKVLVDLAKI